MCHAEAKPPLRFAHGFQPFYALHCAHGLARHTQALWRSLENTEINICKCSLPDFVVDIYILN